MCNNLGYHATTLPAQTVKKDYTHQVDSVLKLMTVEEKSRTNDSVFQ